MISEQKIKEAVELLRQSADPVKIILFGSYARGVPRDDSDLDFLVVEKEVESRYREMIRLQKAILPLRLAADILVVSKKNFEEWSDTPGNVLYFAAQEGKVVYEMEGTGKNPA